MAVIVRKRPFDDDFTTVQIQGQAYRIFPGKP
jgi:hypothetical protein